MDTVRFRLTLTAEQIRSYYEGIARQVIVRASEKKRDRTPPTA